MIDPRATQYAALLGQSSLSEFASRMGDGFRPGGTPSYSSDLSLGLLIVTALAMALWLLRRWAFRAFPGGAKTCATRLFLRLCRAHGLGWSDGWLLWRLARALRLDCPVRLFLEPHRFDAEGLPEPFRRHGTRLAALRVRLFAGLA
jgi:hypothetical protein